MINSGDPTVSISPVESFQLLPEGTLVSIEAEDDYVAQLAMFRDMVGLEDRSIKLRTTALHILSFLLQNPGKLYYPRQFMEQLPRFAEPTYTIHCPSDVSVSLKTLRKDLIMDNGSSVVCPEGYGRFIQYIVPYPVTIERPDGTITSLSVPDDVRAKYADS